MFHPFRDPEVCDTDITAFRQARLTVLGETALTSGIGTLSEKALHKILKFYFEPDEAYHEIPFLGSVADIKNGDGIIEIQTREWKRLIPKLDKFLPVSPVRVVYPLAHTKMLHWLDPATGEISEGKKSPKHETLHDAVWELYNIRKYLSDPNFTLILCYLNVEEYKRRGGRTLGKQNRSTRVERIPNEIEKIYVFHEKADYLAFLPAGLPDEFTAKELTTAVSPHYRYTYSLIQILTEIGLLSEVGKRKNSKLYRIRRENI